MSVCVCCQFSIGLLIFGLLAVLFNTAKRVFLPVKTISSPSSIPSDAGHQAKKAKLEVMSEELSGISYEREEFLRLINQSLRVLGFG